MLAVMLRRPLTSASLVVALAITLMCSPASVASSDSAASTVAPRVRLTLVAPSQVAAGAEVTVKGRLTSRAGQALPRVRVTLHRRAPGGSWVLAGRTRTSRRGYYKLRIVDLWSTTEVRARSARAHTRPAGVSPTRRITVSGTPTATPTPTPTPTPAPAPAPTPTPTSTPDPLRIVSQALPDADEDEAYTTNLATSGGRPPVVWSLDSGALPVGLSVDSGGAISGTPTVEGISSFTLRVVDVDNHSDTRTFDLRVRDVPLQIVTTALPDATQGAPYDAALEARGAEGDLSWTLLPGWSLPAGLDLTPGGKISGRPQAPGTSTFGVEVSDTALGATSAMVSITVAEAPQPAFLDNSLPAGQVGVGYAYLVRVVGGTGTYAWSITGGALPAGLSLNSSTGLISGSPTVTGSGQVTVRAQDGTGSVTQALGWQVTVAGDWHQEAHDAGSSSSAPGERTMTPGNVGAANLEWRMSEENPSDVVADGVLYSGERMPGTFQHGITARDLASGDVLWTRALPGPGSSNNRCDRMAVVGDVVVCQAPYEVMAVSLTGDHAILWRTPDAGVTTYADLVVAGDTVVVIAGSSVAALGLGDGAPRWSRFVSGEARTVSVVGGRVLTTDNGGEIRTFALATGSPGWVATDATNPLDPVIGVPGRDELVSLHAGIISWRSPETGDVLRSWTSMRGVRGALAADAERVYVPTGRFDEFGVMVGAGVAAVRHGDATEAWHRSTFLGIHIGVAVAGELVWVHASDEVHLSTPSNLFALQATTGEQRRLIRVPGQAARAPLVAGGRVITHGGATFVYGLMAAPLRVPWQVLPTGWTSRPYAAALALPTGGDGPYTWSLDSGSLPAGLALDSQGTVSGTPSQIGSAAFTLRATDRRGMTALRVARIAVRAAAPAEWRTLGGGPGRSGVARTESGIDAASIGQFVQRFSTAVVSGDGSAPGARGEEPLVVGTRVYGLGWDGNIRAWSTTDGPDAGPVATTTTLPDGERYAGTPSFDGPPADGTLYALTDRGRLLALDGNSLAQKWAATLPTTTESHEQAPLVAGGVVVVGASGEVVAIDMVTGLRAWTTPMVDAATGATSTDGTRVFVLDGCDLVALRLTDGAVAWRSDLVPGEETCARGLAGPERVAPVVDSGVVFTTAYSAGGTVAITATTGEVRWRTNTLSPRSTPVVSEHYVLTQSYGIALSLLDRHTGELIGHATPEQVDNIRGTPTIVGDLAVFRNSLRIQAVDLLTLQTVWSSPPLEQVQSYSGIAVHEGLVYSYTGDGRVVGFGTGD